MWRPSAQNRRKPSPSGRTAVTRAPNDEARAQALGGAREAVGDEERLAHAVGRLVGADRERVGGEPRLERADRGVVELLDDGALRAHGLDRRADARLAIGLADGQVAAVDEAGIRAGALEHVGQELAAVARDRDDRGILVVRAQHARPMRPRGRPPRRACRAAARARRAAPGGRRRSCPSRRRRSRRSRCSRRAVPPSPRLCAAGRAHARRPRARSSASARSGGSSLVSSTRRPSAGCSNASRAACRNWRRRPICPPGTP